MREWPGAVASACGNTEEQETDLVENDFCVELFGRKC